MSEASNTLIKKFWTMSVFPVTISSNNDCEKKPNRKEISTKGEGILTDSHHDPEIAGA